MVIPQKIWARHLLWERLDRNRKDTCALRHEETKQDPGLGRGEIWCQAMRGKGVGNLIEGRGGDWGIGRLETREEESVWREGV